MYSAACLWLILCISVGLVNGQENETSCYGSGSIATAVILTIIFTILLLGALYYFWEKYRKRKESHLILETDPEKGKGEYAFDNPGFKEVGLTPVTQSLEKSTKFEPASSNSKSKWNHWPHLSATTKSEKRKTLDDSTLDGSQVKVVPLRGHDFTGLGFTVCGNMKEGIYIKDVLHRGPASESGKLSPGDRISSVTISFEHMVYEDALSILSYASPYEVIIEARSGKLITQSPGQGAQPYHPIYRSSSAVNLSPVEHGAKKRLFGEEYAGSVASNYSSLQKSQSNMTTLERKESKSPKPLMGKFKKTPIKSQLSPEQLKVQLEQKIQSDHQQNLKYKENHHNKPQKIEVETQKTENNFQKFGIRVLPPTERSPKSAELSQNDNNINIEKQPIMGIDEVDDHLMKPQVKKREKKHEEGNFKRDEILNGSGIKRDSNGIPQEIPDYMMNAAVAARSNRKNSEDRLIVANKEDEIDKTPSKRKGKAPAPPPNEEKSNMNGGKVSPSNLDEIHSAADDYEMDSRKSTSSQNNDDSGEIENCEVEMRTKEPVKDYNSDSDLEQDNQSSVNTIELNSSEITIHQAEENEDLQNRRTASTGDLTKIQKTAKSGTGTLERAQSLDITDTTIPTLSKKRKGERIEDTFDMKSDEDLFGNALVNKEPRLSLILDGLNTFQRNRLKKSTEWGNLEDAIFKLDKEDAEIKFDQNISLENFDFGEKSHEFDALVNRINEIKRESLDPPLPNLQIEQIEPEPEPRRKKNQIWPTFEEAPEKPRPIPADKRQRKPSEEFALVNADVDKQKKPILPEKKDFLLESRLISKAIYPPSLDTEEVFVEPQISSKSSTKWAEENKPDEIKTQSPPLQEVGINRELLDMTTNFIFTERIASNEDLIEDTNISDDIKVSRHSLGSLERPKSDDAKLNVSNVTISDNIPSDNVSMVVNLDETCVIDDSRFNDLSELYTTALDKTTKPEFDNKVTISTPDIIKNVTITEAINTLNSEREPLSMTLEIPVDSSDLYVKNEFHNNDDDESNRSRNSSLTYITEIQVLTPDTSASTNISEIEIIPGVRRDLDNDFENYVKNFESNVKNYETNIEKFENNLDHVTRPEMKALKTIDPEKELHKIQEIAEEQLKKLPEMRFTTSSYESKPAVTSQEKRQSQIELLRSNFEKSPPNGNKSLKSETKSRIPIATTAKTPPTSPERRDSRNLDMENDRDILQLMSASVHSTSAPLKYQIKPQNISKNVTVTSIRSNSKIPSGLPILSGASRPPIPPRKSGNDDGETNTHHVQVSTNGTVESSFKQWVFNPNSDHSVTNIVVTETKQK